MLHARPRLAALLTVLVLLGVGAATRAAETKALRGDHQPGWWTFLDPDLGNPIRGRAVSSIDAFAGYSRRLCNNKVLWRVQLNVRNLFDDEDLIMQRALRDGAGAIYTVQQPRSLILTNTFSF